MRRVRWVALWMFAVAVLACDGGSEAGDEGSSDASSADSAGPRNDGARSEGPDAGDLGADAQPRDAQPENDGGLPSADAACPGGDEDGDGACDPNDVCPSHADPEQTDTDEDGRGDACECDGVTCEATGSCRAPGSCDPRTGECDSPNLPDGTACDDSNACTLIDACAAGTCEGTDPVTCAAIDACHTVGVCDPASGSCSTPAVSDGTTCDDGNACTRTDACAAGTCNGGDPVLCMAADACHVAGTCDPMTGTCSSPNAPDGTACNDGNACTRSDLCAGGACAGRDPVTCAAADACHVAGTCDPATGSCSSPPAPDGTTCNDGNACTRTDRCASGACGGRDPISCAPIDACHTAGMCMPNTGTCTTPAIAGCTGAVTVRVLSSTSAPLMGVGVHTYDGATEVFPRVTTDERGIATLTLPAGSYRFKAVLDGLPTFSGGSDHCTVPTCTAATITVPAASPYVALTWDPTQTPVYGGGEILDADAHIERAGVYLEQWGVADYGRPTAALTAAHDHLGDECYTVPGRCGNPSNSENQHAFGRQLQGFYVRLSSRRPFDVVSLDYRIRQDTNPEHVSEIPGVDASRVEIWISPVLDTGTPPARPFRAFPVGSRAAMTRFQTLDVAGLTNVTAVYITSTWNVSIDDLVLRPR